MGTRRMRALTVAALLMGALPAVAQQTGGTITGTVTTEAGAVPAGAEVRLEAEAGAGSYATVVGSAGEFRIGPVPAGAYVLRVASLGYRGTERRVAVAAGERVSLDVRLTESPVALGGMVVSAARTSAPASKLPGAVTVVGREAVLRQASVATGLNGALAQVVPGLAAGTGTPSLFGQSFRGRNLSVLIDGVPQSTTRNAMRDLATIDASAIERVEVLRGATAIHGDGATGGVINIITRKPTGGARFTSTLGMETTPADPGGGLGTRLAQSVAGRRGALDYLFSGSRSTTASFFDGEGDRIPSDPQGQGGLADYASWSLLGKVGAELGERRVELSVNGYRGMQETEYTTDPSVDAQEPGTAKARALSGLELSERAGSENLNVVVSFSDRAALGGELRGQAYVRDYLTRFGPFDGRAYLKHVAQSFVDSRKFGARVELERDLPLAGASAVFGLDYTDELTFQGLNLMDAAAYDASGGLVFRKVGETKWVPPILSRGAAAFAQLAWTPVERLSVRGGVRHERVRMSFDPFTNVAGNAVKGGELDYAPLLLNLGAVLDVASGVDLFASYAQGFSLADIGRVLRAAPAGFDLGSRQLDAQLVDHYEVGARTQWRSLSAAASVFYNESDLGTSFDKQLNVIRAPERIRGFEASADLRLLPGLVAGGTYTWTEGESYYAATDEWKALNGFRIQPTKVTGYVEHRTLPSWSNRLQVLYSGERDRAFEDGLTYGHLPVDAYTLVDWTSGIDVGPGRVELGVHNLLDTQYYPVVAQLYAMWGNSQRAAGRGRTLNVGYTVTY